ncbi:hypothetical protein [Streptomyces olivaceiscleroticus]|uniref:DNA-binding protein n=1 Tax=Streptomyces olivaceiscleroticus TaxID=68245 RepID=A0ABP3JI23_9ACTN
MAGKWDGLRLAGLTEAAQVMGITKQAAARALKRAGAPRPLADLAQGPVWDLDEIETWNASRRRTPGRPRAASTDTAGC